MNLRTILCAVLLLLTFSGCAFLNRNNTPLLNWVDETLWPEKPLVQVAVFPLVFPAGLVAVVIDAAVIHPVSVIDDAAESTGDLLWYDLDWHESYVTECAALPWRTVFSPIVFSTGFLCRSFFNIQTEAERIRHCEDVDRRQRKKREQAAKQEARTRLLNRAARELVRSKLNEENPAGALLALMQIQDDPLNHEEGIALISQHPSQADSSLARWCAFWLQTRSEIPYSQRLALLVETLADPDPLLRFSAVDWLWRQDSEIRENLRVRKELGKMAENDPDQHVRAYARIFLQFE